MYLKDYHNLNEFAVVFNMICLLFHVRGVDSLSQFHMVCETIWKEYPCFLIEGFLTFSVSGIIKIDDHEL
jgi:hypothetical protein